MRWVSCRTVIGQGFLCGLNGTEVIKVRMRYYQNVNVDILSIGS